MAPKNNNAEILQAARELIAAGVRVLPIRPGMKHPPMSAWQRAATNDLDTVEGWFSGIYKDHGLGVATGSLADGRNFFVLDVDEHGAGVSGGDTLADLEKQNGPLPETLEALTGSGGRHLYFLCDAEIRNDAGKRLGPGLDVRGAGGQVVAPPTLHPNGRRYEWVDGSGPDETPMAPAPTWLTAMLADPTPQQNAVSIEPKKRDAFLVGDPNDSIADRYNLDTSWDELLGQDGWHKSHVDPDGEAHWTRPGKDPRHGTSATTNYKGLDVLKVFSSSIAWLPEGAYSRFQYFSRRHHNGDMSQAAKALARRNSWPQPSPKPGDEWPDLIPLTTTVVPPMFDSSTMPAWITEHAAAVAQDLEVSVDLPLNLALGALSVTALGNASVRYPRKNWTQPLNLYIAVALPPSTGKSPAKAAMFSALEQFEQERMNEAARAVSEYETELRILKARLKACEELAAKSRGMEGQEAHDDAFAIAAKIAKLKKPITGKMFVDNVTEEALGIELADAGGSIAMVSAEGGLFDRMAGMYSEKNAGLDLYLEAWSGGRYSVSRVGRSSISVASGNLCIVTTVQPQVLEDIGAQKLFAGRGLTQRFLLSTPESTVGLRDRTKHSKTDDEVRREYDSRISEMASRLAKDKPQIRIEGEASDIFASWDQYHETKIRQGAELDHLAEWVGKVRASVLRIAALLHLAEGNVSSTVSGETMEKAIRIGNYYVAQQQAISDSWGVGSEILLAKKIIDWLYASNTKEFSARHLQRRHRTKFSRIEDARATLEILVERGWIRPLFDGPLVLGQRGKDSPRFEVRPRAQLEAGVSPASGEELSQLSELSHFSSPNSSSEELGSMSHLAMGSMREKYILSDISLSKKKNIHERGSTDKCDMEPNSPKTGDQTQKPSDNCDMEPNCEKTDSRDQIDTGLF